MSMHRREFLKQTAVAAAMLSASGLRTFTVSQGRLERRGAPKRVIVVGAGLAGLSAAYELTRQVTTSPFSRRAPGRAVVFTHSAMPLPTGSTRKPVPHAFPIITTSPSNTPSCLVSRSIRLSRVMCRPYTTCVDNGFA